MDINAATQPELEPPQSMGSVSGASGLSIMQREFARQFVISGGKAREAAIAAGYAAASAHVSANKCLVNPRVGAEIQRLSRSLIHTALPTLIRELIELATDKTIAPRDRLKALNSLLERGGIATEKTGVNVNVGLMVNGQQAQAIIAEVHDRRQRRLSDIPPAMPDTLDEDLETIEALAIAPPTATPGGVDFQGPASGSCPLPVPSTEHCDNRGVSDDGPAAEFRKAFDDEEE